MKHTRSGGAIAALACALALAPLRAQGWRDLQGRSRSGFVALQQALLDARADALALIVASHPDDRYVLPAIALRHLHGVRVAVLLATRGGGGQNSLGPETGDVLERIRTLETEAGCQQFGGEVWYLDRPDAGFVRTAAEAFDDWGRDETLAALVRVLRTVRPDVVVTTHHAEELHGHDLALAALLPEAFDRAGDPAVDDGRPPHRPRALFLGATSTPVPDLATIASDEFEPVRGSSLGQLAYEILLRYHVSPGAPASRDQVFGQHLAFAPVRHVDGAPPRSLHGGLPSLFDDSIWPGSEAERSGLQQRLTALPTLVADRASLIEAAREVHAALLLLPCDEGSQAALRRDRRTAALLDVIRHAAGVQVEVEPPPGAVAVPGEELDLAVRVHAGGPIAIDGIGVRSDEGTVALEPLDGDGTAVAAGGTLHAVATYRVPMRRRGGDMMAERFTGDRFVPPVRLHFAVAAAGVTLPIRIDVPVDLRPTVELNVVPRMLLLPTTRDEVEFTVEVVKNTAFPVRDKIEVRAPAGYQVEGARTEVELGSVRSDFFEFKLRAPSDRKSRVDVVRIAFGESRVMLPVHMVDARIDPALRIGLVRSRDDALLSVLGIGGFGLHWAELSDIDLAVRNLDEFDTIVVDVRALRDRPAARRSFRRLLDFCRRPSRRLVVLYHKDTEFDPPGESFRGAPFTPFQIGRSRVTREDAPVTILRPDHPIWTTPNRILPSDWDGWEQERGLYFPSVYSDRYQELLEVHDPGLPPERSALLYARCGDGEFVYCSLALWRQWKKLHAGSVRILANLLTPEPPPR